MRITANEMRAAATAARSNAQRAAEAVRDPSDDQAIAIETAGRSWIILPQPVAHQRGLRRWNIVAEGEGTIVASGVIRAVAEHLGNWDPNIGHAVAALLDDFADQYEASTVTATGQLVHPGCLGIIHAGDDAPFPCHCFDVVTELVKSMQRGAQ